MKIFVSLPCIYYNPMKVNLTICLILFLSSWWQQPLGKTYALHCRNRVMVSASFAFSKTKSCRQHVLWVPLWLNGKEQIVNDKKQYTTEHHRKRWDRTDLTILTKTQTSLTRFTSIKPVKQEDFCGAISLTYFAGNCLDLPACWLPELPTYC